MVEHFQIGLRKPAGQIVAKGVSEADYMEHYSEHFYEWVRGFVIKMVPESLKHDRLIGYFRMMFEAYFALNPIGVVIDAPFVMRLPTVGVNREPDLQIILKSNPAILHETYMDGAADICIEIVSKSNASTDYGDKLEEYEQGGVGEYWIFDPRRKAALFYRMDENGVYISHLTDENGEYRSPRLPKFKINVSVLWEDELPNFFAIASAIQEMLKSS